jgi:hypothetical protein
VHISAVVCFSQDDTLFGLIEAEFSCNDVFQPSDIPDVATGGQTQSTASTGMVGSPSKELESANELIRFDHMYSKMIPDIGAEADVETCLVDMSNCGDGLLVERDENTSVVTCNTSDEIDSAEKASIDCGSNESISALAILDLIDLAAELEELNQATFTSCLDQDRTSTNSCSTDSNPSEPVQSYSSCGSPFMQLNDELPVVLDSESCNVPSPSSGYGSLSGDLKSPLLDDLDESVFSLPVDDCGFSWEETCTLFPSLDSYS